jgi:hypothetical protein
MAAELRPKTPLLEQALLQLDGNSASPAQSDVLFVVQSGLAPARDSMSIPLPLVIDENLVITPLSFPVIREDRSTAHLDALQLDGRPLALTLLNSTSAMSRRALRDDMPGIILRTSARAVSRTLAQKKLNERPAGRPDLRHRVDGAGECRYPYLAHPARPDSSGPPAPEARRAPTEPAGGTGRPGST